jgi:WD40 repeat protein
LHGEARKVRDADGAAVTRLRASRDGRYLATGTATGVVTVYDTASWRIMKTIRTEGGIRRIDFDPRNRDLLIAAEPGRSQFGHVQLVELTAQRPFHWNDVIASPRDVAYSPDGDTLGFVCADGSTWLYSIPGDTWAYTRDHDTDTNSGMFSPDGRLFASIDRRGLVVTRSVASTFRIATNPHTKERQ